jgi:hypothetical protein
MHHSAKASALAVVSYPAKVKVLACSSNQQQQDAELHAEKVMTSQAAKFNTL